MNCAAIIFLAYLAINSGSSSSAWSGNSNYPSRNKYGDGEVNDSCKRINEFTTIAEDNANQTRKVLQIMEQRMNSFEKTQNNINETLISFEKTQASFQKTLINIERILNEMRVISNSTTNLETEDKENSTTQLYTPVTKTKAQMTFDGVIKGRNVQLSSDLRTATRTKPTEDKGLHGSVVSNSPLEEDKVFQIRIDERMYLWTDYGIGIGVMEEKKEWIKETGYIFANKGTWAIYSDFRHQSGKSTTYKDGSKITINEYPFQTHYLPVGTTLGVLWRSDGNLHFYLNGVDNGVAFRNVPRDVYAFVDVIHYATKISITN